MTLLNYKKISNLSALEIRAAGQELEETFVDGPAISITAS
jgi:hypothetical protein